MLIGEILICSQKEENSDVLSQPPWLTCISFIEQVMYFNPSLYQLVRGRYLKEYSCEGLAECVDGSWVLFDTLVCWQLGYAREILNMLKGLDTILTHTFLILYLVCAFFIIFFIYPLVSLMQFTSVLISFLRVTVDLLTDSWDTRAPSLEEHR